MQAEEQVAALTASNGRLAAELEVERGRAAAVVTAVSGKAEEVGSGAAEEVLLRPYVLRLRVRDRPCIFSRDAKVSAGFRHNTWGAVPELTCDG